MMEDVVPSEPQAQAAVVHPSWFVDFLADRAVRKPSPHTIKPTVKTSKPSPFCWPTPLMPSHTCESTN